MRRPNFNDTECQTLVDLAVANIEMIQCKFSSLVTVKKKAEIWQQITDSINAVSFTTRSRDEVKKKWQDMVADTRKRESARRMCQRGTGGGAAPKPLLKIQEQILGVISKTIVTGIEGGVESTMEDSLGSILEMEGDWVHPTSMYTDEGQSPCATLPQKSAGVRDENAAIPISFSKDDVTYKRKIEISQTVASDANETCSDQKKSRKGKKIQSSLCEDTNHDQLIKIEEERLQLERERLKIDKERHAMEKERLEIEKARLLIEQQKLKRLQSNFSQIPISPSLSVSPIINFL